MLSAHNGWAASSAAHEKIAKQSSQHADALEMEPCSSRTTPKALPWLWMGEKWPGGQISIT